MQKRIGQAVTVVVAASLLAAGCETAAQRAVRVQPPPQSLPAVPAAYPLPLPAGGAGSLRLMPEPAPPLEALFAYAQKALESGEQNYRAGHLGKARRDFDRALDALLSSGYDPASDPRLDELFERIVSTVHGYEVAAFREGDGFSEPREVPAPIDEIADLSFPIDARVRATAEAALKDLPHDLPVTLADPVLAYLNFFQTPRGKSIVEAGLRRAGRYREMISRILAEEGLPQDLVYLAQAESGFKPQALSRARALGMWQFMAGTGRLYGLQRNWWVDDRRDPEKATRAAARHLRDLYDQFGDWYLAMAAYNSGPGNVARAIERTGYADFWELYRRNVLPRETRNYVPIILALTIIAKDPERYGIQVDPEPPLRADRIKPSHPIDLRLVAETIDVPLEELKELNPHLLRMVTPASPEFELNLPAGTAERFFAEIASIPPQNWVTWRRHRVAEGETLGHIARRFRVPPEAIAEANSLQKNDPLLVGTKLIIPATAATGQGRLGEMVRYRVRRGDTLALIAQQFGVTPADVRRWNGLKSDRVARGATLKVYVGGKPEPASRSARTLVAGSGSATPALKSAKLKHSRPAGQVQTHRVKAGDTLWSIARAYDTTVEALREANQFLFKRTLQVGDVLAIAPRP